MRIYNTYIISIVLAAGIINIILAFLGQNDLSIYFILNLIAYLIITLLFAYLNPRARRALNAVGAVIFTGFVVIVVLKTIEILSKK